MCDAFVSQFVCLFQVGQLCYQVFLDMGKANIGDLLAVRTENSTYHSTSSGSCTEFKLKLVTDDPPKNTWVFLDLAKRVYFFSGVYAESRRAVLRTGDCVQRRAFAT